MCCSTRYGDLVGVTTCTGGNFGICDSCADICLSVRGLFFVFFDIANPQVYVSWRCYTKLSCSIALRMWHTKTALSSVWECLESPRQFRTRNICYGNAWLKTNFSSHSLRSQGRTGSKKSMLSLCFLLSIRHFLFSPNCAQQRRFVLKFHGVYIASPGHHRCICKSFSLSV